ncbi:MAG: hypothetical protein V1922_03180 [bacterium]
MVKTVLKEWQAKVAALLFLVYSAWWISLQYSHLVANPAFDYFASTYCLMALWGGIWGIYIAQKWGGWKSLMGRAILFFSFGLFAQAFGQICYSYYVMVLHIEVPYPSIGDLGYFGSIPLYTIGISLLAQASGISLSLKSFQSKIQAIVIPILLLVGSYYIFLRNYTFDWTHPLTIFLDFGYPLGQSVYIAIALLAFLLSRKMLGGRMKKRVIFIMIALFIQFCADFVFLYQANNGEWLAAGINDFMYFVGYYIMTLGLLQLNTVYEELRKRA